jgi:hypothetical protein
MISAATHEDIITGGGSDDFCLAAISSSPAVRRPSARRWRQRSSATTGSAGTLRPIQR